MKKLILIAVAAIFATACSPSYKVQGEIVGLSGKTYLAVLEGKVPRVIDSTQTVDGKFTFTGQIPSPLLAIIQDSAQKAVTMFFLENSKIEIKGSMEQRDSITVVGSPETDLFRAITDSMAKADNEKYKEVIEEFVTSHPKSYAAAYTFFRQMTPALDFLQMRQYAAGFDTTVRQSIYITLVEQKAATLEKTSQGHPFVDFSAVDTLGNSVALSSIAGKGQWVLLDFWASWCGPCRAENPTVVKAYNMYKDNGFTVFGVSLDRERGAWARAIVADSLNWTNVSDLKFWNSEPAALYGVSSIPSNAIIAPDGTIAARNLRGEALLTFLSDKLGSSPLIK